MEWHWDGVKFHLVN
jgi:hypothetical protein